MSKIPTSKLRESREKKGLTLADVAKRVGTNAGNLSRIERGIQNPGLKLARRIGHFYRLPLDIVFGDIQPPHSSAQAEGDAA